MVMEIPFEDQALWRKVINDKKGTEGQWCTRSVTNSYGVSVWKSIRTLCQDFASNISIKVGNGLKTSFWNDDLIGNGPLKEIFPDIFSLVQQPDATLAEIWSQQSWDLTFRDI